MVGLGACRRPAMVERATADGILLVGNGPEPEGLDPAFTTSTSALQIQQALFEGLVVPHPEDLSAQPGVAERWEVSADGTEWTFHLREEARWSNGAPVTAADFVAGWRRMLEPAAGAPNASLFYPIAGAEAFNKGETADFATVGIRAVSPRRLEVRLQFPAPYFAGLLAHPAFSPIPEEHVRSLGDPLDRGNPWTRPAHFVGNGPFVLAEWKPHQYLEVQKSPTYWDSGTVGLEGIRFFPIDDLGAEERAFQAGQLHVTEALPPGRLKSWTREGPSMLRIDPYLGTYYILINHRHPPLDQVAVRRALSAVIPREAITGQLLGAGQLPATAFTPPGIAGYKPPQMELDENSARGVSLAGTELRYLFNSSESHRLIAEALAARWSESLGVEMVLENVEARTYFDRRSKADFQLARAVWIGDYVDPMTFLALWRTGGGGSDWSGWSDPAYDAMLDAAERAGTAAERHERLRAAEERLLEAQVMIPLYHYVTVYLLRPEVTGWHPTPLDWHPWKYVGLRKANDPS
jgi:oligopeptide transport system substrate-binding protein